jgi:hypothetical protein
MHNWEDDIKNIWEDDIKIDLREDAYEGADWAHWLKARIHCHICDK